MGEGGVGDPPVSRYTWLSGAAQQQLEAVGLGPPAKFSSVRLSKDFSCVPASLALCLNGVTGRICSLQHPPVLALVTSLVF